MRFINLLLDLCQGWEEILTLRKEELKEWWSVISVQGGVLDVELGYSLHGWKANKKSSKFYEGH